MYVNLVPFSIVRFVRRFYSDPFTAFFISVLFSRFLFIFNALLISPKTTLSRKTPRKPALLIYIQPLTKFSPSNFRRQNFKKLKKRAIFSDPRSSQAFRNGAVWTYDLQHQKTEKNAPKRARRRAWKSALSVAWFQWLAVSVVRGECRPCARGWAAGR
ncbi:hypothetical protein ACFO3I_05035 [Rheinheimera marina]|uniref:Uncharacterized protein n=1 Tax=Rheinheimera marina TaxID=1774958 RepID=A0ABV9JJ24_9GAMM